MSEMEIFYGTYKKSDVVASDEKDLFDQGEELGLNLVNVDGQIYEFESLEDLDAYGFSLNIPPSDETRCMCLWYNGGAGIHEVMENLIRKSLKEPTP